MPASHGSIARLYANGFDLTAAMRGATHSGSADVAETSVWGMGSKAYIPGLADATLSGEGIVDAQAAGGLSDDVLAQALGGQVPIYYAPTGDVLGGPVKIVDGIVTAYEPTSPVDDVTSFSMEAQSSNVPGVGRILRPLAGALNISVAGNGSAVDDTSYMSVPPTFPTPFGGVGIAQIINKGGGAGTLTLRIEDSADGSTGWATILTFTGQTLIAKAEIVRITGNVRRWLRAAWACTGGTWDVAVGFARRMQ